MNHWLVASSFICITYFIEWHELQNKDKSNTPWTQVTEKKRIGKNKKYIKQKSFGLNKSTECCVVRSLLSTIHCKIPDFATNIEPYYIKIIKTINEKWWQVNIKSYISVTAY